MKIHHIKSMVSGAVLSLLPLMNLNAALPGAGTGPTAGPSCPWLQNYSKNGCTDVLSKIANADDAQIDRLVHKYKGSSKRNGKSEHNTLQHDMDLGYKLVIMGCGACCNCRFSAAMDKYLYGYGLRIMSSYGDGKMVQDVSLDLSGLPAQKLLTMTYDEVAQCLTDNFFDVKDFTVSLVPVTDLLPGELPPHNIPRSRLEHWSPSMSTTRSPVMSTHSK